MKPEGKLNGTWELCEYSDTYYALYDDTRKSVTGYIFLINGVGIE